MTPAAQTLRQRTRTGTSQRVPSSPAAGLRASLASAASRECHKQPLQAPRMRFIVSPRHLVMESPVRIAARA
eukprot:364743-Chlamydomonas_euryale.AAC.5